MLSSPLEPKIGKAARKALARRLRALLSRGPIGMREIANVLEVAPEAVVIGLRELRTRHQGRLRSKIRYGHVSWWWERDGEPHPPHPPVSTPPPAPLPESPLPPPTRPLLPEPPVVEPPGRKSADSGKRARQKKKGDRKAEKKR